MDNKIDLSPNQFPWLTITVTIVITLLVVAGGTWAYYTFVGCINCDSLNKNVNVATEEGSPSEQFTTDEDGGIVEINSGNYQPPAAIAQDPENTSAPAEIQGLEEENTNSQPINIRENLQGLEEGTE